jgi:hypothetical protein
MSFTFSVNQTPLDCTDGIFKFLTAAKAAGWTVPTIPTLLSSDGISSYPSAITQSRTSTGGLQNPNAWFVLQQPGSTRQLCFQRSADATNVNNNWMILYSPAAGFISGAPGVTKVPVATDEVVILSSSTNNGGIQYVANTTNNGGLIEIQTVSANAFITGNTVTIAGVTGTTEANGTWVITKIDTTHFTLNGSAFVNAYVSGGVIQGTPVFASFASNASENSGTRWHMMFGDSSFNYGFTHIAFVNGTQGVSGAFMLDVLLAGSYPSADTDPCVIYQNDATGYGNDLRVGTGNLRAYMGSVTPSAFVPIYAAAYYGGVVLPATLGSNAWSGKDDIISVPYLRQTATPYGFKGFGTIITYVATPRGSTDLLTVFSLKDRLCVNGCLLHWPTGTDILI